MMTPADETEIDNCQIKKVKSYCKNDSRFFFLSFDQNSSVLVLLISVSLPEPAILHCNIVWSSMYPMYVKRLHLLQKRVRRVILHADFLDHTWPLFKELKILDIFKLTL